MFIVRNKDIKVYKFRNLSQSDRILHFVSTRSGGVSKSPYQELNLGFHVGDNVASVLLNRVLLLNSVGIPIENIVCCQQIHGCNTAVIEASMRGFGAKTYDSALPATDALITNNRNICLFILVADCVPILLFDPEKCVIGVVHAGWKGTLLNITGNTIRNMTLLFGSEPENIIAGIGPSIGPANYEVGREIVEVANSSFPNANLVRVGRGGRIYFDLWKANCYQLLTSGLLRKNIEIAGICTFAHSETFFSHRRERVTGRFCAAISLLS